MCEVRSRFCLASLPVRSTPSTLPCVMLESRCFLVLHSATINLYVHTQYDIVSNSNVSGYVSHLSASANTERCQQVLLYSLDPVGSS